VATAMAQIIRFHKFPSGYDYTLMLARYRNSDVLATTSGAQDVARLMRDCGKSVDMWYQCDGSGAMAFRIPNALENKFGYSEDARRDDFDKHITDLKNNIEAGYPVILDADRDWAGVHGHTWVCDGYSQNRWYNCESGMTSSSTLMLHMNWGWNNNSRENDTMYAYNDWAPKTSDNFDYKYHQKITYNIHP